MATPSRSVWPLVLLVVCLAALVIVNGWYWLVRPVSTGRQLVQPDLMSTGSATYTVAATAVDRVWLVGGIVGVVVVLAIVGWWVAGRVAAGARKSRDGWRRRSLAVLQEGLEAYQYKTGHYPLGTMVGQREVPAVGTGFEWDEMGFPSSLEMTSFVPGWPIVDPLVPAEQRDQSDQFLYYPSADGLSYALYARMEMPEKPVVDYTQQDGLPSAWGTYTVKLTSDQFKESLQQAENLATIEAAVAKDVGQAEASDTTE